MPLSADGRKEFLLGFAPDMTIESARAYLRARWEEGTYCPCCTQRVQIYSNQITSAMARGLILMWQTHGVAWHVKATVLRPHKLDSRNDALMAHWGLIARPRQDEVITKRRGVWRVTYKGARFANGTLHVPQFASVFDATCYALWGPPVAIYDCLERDFDLEELLGTREPWRDEYWRAEDEFFGTHQDVIRGL